MIPVSLLLAGLFLLGFLRSVSGGQFDDTTSPAVRALDDGTTDSERNPESKTRIEP